MEDCADEVRAGRITRRVARRREAGEFGQWGGFEGSTCVRQWRQVVKEHSLGPFKCCSCRMRTGTRMGEGGRESGWDEP